uniref:Predicted RNA binding protein YcfA, dsRBD-like fold, HicA-like mRNA interferase family n=1 Tax=Candidatus Kentrum sp. DK TaxID=2126562 RepID=A0A450S3I7_9GAMM|nr:MAG: Predicted RNA binding protein YcfA, dsRBD-like fold, HicA-like mRNA interferase family [Candidatus Kentron sp. DK]VFJ57980.1 MAG: Predicted RNA binding protein YcfA, dsRBD-like fold, HicA-like mRNA interferase family [Candidatus Kentron sp. DK]
MGFARNRRSDIRSPLGQEEIRIESIAFSRFGCDLGRARKFSELVRLLEKNGYRLMKEKGSIRYYGKGNSEKIIRVDYHGAKEVPKGACQTILKAANVWK